MSLEVLIVGGIVAVIVGLIAVTIWLSNKKGYTTAQMDEAQAALDEIERVNNAKKEIDIKRANTPIDKQLQQVDYRD